MHSLLTRENLEAVMHPVQYLNHSRHCDWSFIDSSKYLASASLLFSPLRNRCVQTAFSAAPSICRYLTFWREVRETGSFLMGGRLL